MHRSIKRDGTIVEWTGLSTCYCTECEVLFASVAAFDFHLKRPRRSTGSDPARHDYSSMPVNEKGYRITSHYKGPGSTRVKGT